MFGGFAWWCRVLDSRHIKSGVWFQLHSYEDVCGKRLIPLCLSIPNSDGCLVNKNCVWSWVAQAACILVWRVCYILPGEWWLKWCVSYTREVIRLLVNYIFINTRLFNCSYSFLDTNVWLPVSQNSFLDTSSWLLFSRNWFLDTSLWIPTSVHKGRLMLPCTVWVIIIIKGVVVTVARSWSCQCAL